MAYNRFAIISFVCACATLLSFCMGLLPIPFTAVICYPLAAVTSLAALISGGISFRQIQMNGERGQWLAWVGIGVGALTLIAVVCLSVLAVSLYPYIQKFIQEMLPTRTP